MVSPFFVKKTLPESCFSGKFENHFSNESGYSAASFQFWIFAPFFVRIWILPPKFVVEKHFKLLHFLRRSQEKNVCRSVFVKTRQIGFVNFTEKINFASSTTFWRQMSIVCVERVRGICHYAEKTSPEKMWFLSLT